jgi:hypothetical protein
MTQALHAIGPLDGRYRGRLQGVADYFSEYSYIKHRVEVEIEYFINLLQLDPPLPQLSGLVVNDALLAKLRAVRAYSDAHCLCQSCCHLFAVSADLQGFQ